jgi:phenylacetate-CoA ligase
LYKRDLETMDPGERRGLQETRLGRLVEWLSTLENPYWKQKLAGTGKVDSLDRLGDLPFTDKAEFRETYPYGMVTVPMEHVVRVHASSGTSGKPTIVAYTAEDVRVFAEVVARSLSAVGGDADDIVHNAYGYGLFTGGVGFHYGIEELGATTVPVSGGNPGFQVGLMADTGATGLSCTPSFALVLAERAAAEGVKDRIKLRWGIHGAEPWSEGLRQKIEDAWGGGYDACDVYGLSEVIGPGVAVECRENKGALHIMEDHFLPEVVDPETGAPVADGEQGELVLTTLTRRAQPVIRYRTRDITHLVPGRCPCGRTTRRMARIEGRADDMLIIRGVNVYPRTIEEILMSDPDLGPNYAIIVDRRGPLPELEARVELVERVLADRRDVIARRLQDRIMKIARLRVEVEVGMPGSVPRTEMGKAQRVFERTTDSDPLI